MDQLTKQWWRLGGFMGIGVIVAFIVAGIIQGEQPTYEDSISDIRAYWEDDGQAYLVGDYIFGLASFLLLLPFIVCVKTLLERAEGGARIVSTTALLGGLLIVALAWAASASWAAMAFGSENVSDDGLVTLTYLDVAAFQAFPLALGLFVLASSLVIATTGVVWRWVGYLGFIVGIAAFLAPLGILDEDAEDVFDIIGFILAFIGFAVWGLFLSVAMILMKEEPAQA